MSKCQSFIFLLLRNLTHKKITRNKIAHDRSSSAPVIPPSTIHVVLGSIYVKKIRISIVSYTSGGICFLQHITKKHQKTQLILYIFCEPHIFCPSHPPSLLNSFPPSLSYNRYAHNKIIISFFHLYWLYSSVCVEVVKDQRECGKKCKKGKI